MMIVSLAGVLVISSLVLGGTLDFQGQVLVHLFEWSWTDIAKECEEFLSKKGYAGVQISPPTEELVSRGQWWERYQVVSYKLISRSGNEDQLKDMITRCNRVGVRVFADVVFNHMTGDSKDCRGRGGSVCKTFDNADVHYTKKDFILPPCPSKDDNNNQEVKDCERVGLHDLDQSVQEGQPKMEETDRPKPIESPADFMESFREKMAKLLNDLVDNLVASVRVFTDTVLSLVTEVSFLKNKGYELYYPEVPYKSADFHLPSCAIKDYKNKHEVRNCELVGLHDLDQSRESVRGKIVKLMNHLVDLGVAGFRIDAAKHMDPADLSVIYSRLKDLNQEHGFPAQTKPFIFQEVIDLGGEAVKYEEYVHLGLVTDFRFGNELGRCFQGNNPLKWLKTFGDSWNIVPAAQSIVFIENHDTERSDSNINILNYKKSRAYKMAVVFMLAWGDYFSKVLSSYEFSYFDQGPPTASLHPIANNICQKGWLCQHRWRQIYNAVAFHKVVKGTEVNLEHWWDNGNNQIAFCRGNKGFIAFNLEEYYLRKTLQTCLPEGDYCDIISGEVTSNGCSGRTVHVASNGEAEIVIANFDPQNTMTDDGVLAIHVESKL